MPKLTLLDPNKTGRQAEDLENQLRNLVVGQTKPFTRSSRLIKPTWPDLSPVQRPVGNFLFPWAYWLWKKLAIVEATAESLLNDSRSVIKIDCAEFQHSHEIAKFDRVASWIPWGTAKRIHCCRKEALNQHHTEKIKLSFVLFDEIEKASDALWNLLLASSTSNSDIGRQSQSRFLRDDGFSPAIFGAAEMSSHLSRRFGSTLPRRRTRGNAQLSAGFLAPGSRPPAESSRRNSLTVWTKS